MPRRSTKTATPSIELFDKEEIITPEMEQVI